MKDGYAVMQSCGVTSGPWPGYEMPQFDGTDNDWYEQNIDGMNISDYDDKMSALYEAIKSVEFNGAGYGNGLFLVSNTKVNQIEWGGKGSGDYCNALKIAAKDHSSFGADNGCAWLGTVNSGDAWCAD